MHVDLTPAYVLHTRNYTDTRILVELFTAAEGRVGAVARGGKKSPRFSLLRPFQPLLVSWLGRSDLKTLSHFESAGRGPVIAGTALYCGIYLNELLVRVLMHGDPHPTLFPAYERALTQLASGDVLEPVLRGFELDLLTELGYGISFDTQAESGEPIIADEQYQFLAGDGFVPVSEPDSRLAYTTVPRFSGAEILAVGQREFSAPGAATAAKAICRLALRPLLGDKPLKSRELFR